jgi:dolichol-phosphate mannosyltransferase
MARLSAVVPVYRAETSLAELHLELVAAMRRVTDDYSILYVDDASPDGSWECIQALAATDPRVSALHLIRNFGEHVAISAGLDQVDADFVVVIACDLQDDPSAIPEMVRVAQQGADLVLARRMRRQDPVIKRSLARMFYAVIAFLVHVNYDYRVGNYRLLTRRVHDYFRLYRERSRNVNAIMALMKVRTAYVDVAHRPRRHGHSSYTFWRSLKMAADVVLDYSHIPLLFSSVVGALLLLLSVIWGLGAVIVSGGVSSSAVVALAIMFVGGLVLINLGIVGAYLGRAATEARERPLYFVDRAVGGALTTAAYSESSATVERFSRPSLAGSRPTPRHKISG